MRRGGENTEIALDLFLRPYRIEQTGDRVLRNDKDKQKGKPYVNRPSTLSVWTLPVWIDLARHGMARR